MDLILAVIFGGVPAWLMNRVMLRTIQPRRSALRFLAYVVISLAAAFVYTFIFVALMLRVLPAAWH